MIGTIEELATLREQVKKDPKRKKASSLYYGSHSRERQRTIRRTMYIWGDTDVDQKVKKAELACAHCKYIPQESNTRPFTSLRVHLRKRHPGLAVPYVIQESL